jgi:hypothetical protein
MDAILFAECLNMGLNLMQVAVVKTGEQVVLNLHVQASCEPEHKPIARGHIV